MKHLKMLTLFVVLGLSTGLWAKPFDKNKDDSLSDIEFLDVEDNTKQDLDLVKHLPDGFDPYAGMIIDPATIHFELEESVLHLDFDTAAYLPKGFNPYVGL